MASTFQNRLVGTIILVAIAVIFLPELLDGEKQRAQDRFEVIPNRPPMKTLSQPEIFPHEEVNNAVSREMEIVEDVAIDDPLSDSTLSSGTVNSNPGQENTNLQAAAMPVMEPKQTAVNSGWVIQLGSFRHTKNVKELLRKLEQAGYRAFSRPVQTSTGTLTKVFVGPDLRREKLEQAISHLEQVTGLKGQIAQFKVAS